GRKRDGDPAVPGHAQLPVHHAGRDRSRRIPGPVGAARPVPAQGPGPAGRLAVDTRRLTRSHQVPREASGMSTSGWHLVDRADVPGEGRVRSVVVDGRPVALARCGERLGALENRCPHQGGPLGEGSIENGWLRCPWHGYDYDPLTGQPP